MSALPDAPTDVAVNVTGTTATVTWNAPGGATTQTVTLSATGEADREQEVSGTAEEAIFQGLTAPRLR